MATDLGFSTVVKIGATASTIEDVKVEPIVEYLPGSSRDKTVTGQEKWVGGLRCRWTYPDRLLSGEQFYQLKSLVGNSASASVVIDIPTQTINLTTYLPVVATYNAIMHWPEEGVTQISMNRWAISDDGILFTQLTNV